jgi:pyrimidine-nucleoside phosphorylase
MISGRGLGHTGGTLDKLESIPGFRVGLSVPEFHRVLKACGCCMIGQTEKIAPADRKLYALRDVTGTVESPYLICASIMSKKLAEGTDALVLDVKTGSGAFMKKRKTPSSSPNSWLKPAKRMGKQMVALITDMNQPLGRMVGNALEVQECIEVLHGGGPADLRELCLELAAWMFYLGGASKTVARASNSPSRSSRPAKPSTDSATWSSCREATSARSTIRPASRADHRVEVPSPKRICDGDRLRTGRHACVILGGGRERKEDSVDPAVGIVCIRRSATRFPPASRSAPFIATPTRRPRARKHCWKRAIRSRRSARAQTSLIHRVIYKGSNIDR